MKRLAMNLAMAACLSSAVAVTGLANETNHKATLVTFREDVLVNDRLVKQGVYRVLFNADSRRLTILNRDGSIAATAKVNVLPSTSKALAHAVSSVSTPRGQVMTVLVFAGEWRVLTLASDANVNNTADGGAQ